MINRSHDFKPEEYPGSALQGLAATELDKELQRSTSVTTQTIIIPSSREIISSLLPLALLYR